MTNQGYQWQYSTSNSLGRNENNLNIANTNTSSFNSQYNTNIRQDQHLPKEQLLGQTSEVAVLASGYEGKRLFPDKQLETTGQIANKNIPTNISAPQMLIRPSGGSFSYSGQQQAAQPVILKQQFTNQEQHLQPPSLQSPQYSQSPIAFNLSPERLTNYSQRSQQISFPSSSATIAQQLSQLQQNQDKQPFNKTHNLHAENTFSSPIPSIEPSLFPRTPSKTLVSTSITPASLANQNLLNTSINNNNNSNLSSSVSRPAEINSSYSRMYLSVPKAELNLQPNNDDSMTNSPSMSNSSFYRKANPMRGSSSCKPLAAQQLQQYQISPKTSSTGASSTTNTNTSAVTLKNNKENFNNSLTKIFFNSPRLKQDIQDISSNDKQPQQQQQQQQQQEQVSSTSYQQNLPSDSHLIRGNALMDETTKRQRPLLLSESQMKSPAISNDQSTHLDSYTRYSPSQPRLLFPSSNNNIQQTNPTKEIIGNYSAIQLQQQHISNNQMEQLQQQPQQILQSSSQLVVTTKNISLDGVSKNSNGNTQGQQLYQQQVIGQQQQQQQLQQQIQTVNRENNKQRSDQNLSGKASRSGSCSQKQSSSSVEQPKIIKQSSSSSNSHINGKTTTQRIQDNSLAFYNNLKLNRDSSSSSSSAKHSSTTMKSNSTGNGVDAMSSSLQHSTPQMLGSKGKLKLASFKNAVAGSSSQPSTNVFAVKVNTFMKNFANTNNTSAMNSSNSNINGYPSTAGSPNSSKLMASTKLLYERKTTSQLNENNDTSRVAEKILDIKVGNNWKNTTINNVEDISSNDKSYVDQNNINNQPPNSSIVSLKDQIDQKQEDNNKYNNGEKSITQHNKGDSKSNEQQLQQQQEQQQQQQFVQEQPIVTVNATNVHSGSLQQLSIASVTNFPQAVSANPAGQYDSSINRTTSNTQVLQQQQLKQIPISANPNNLEQAQSIATSSYENPNPLMSQIPSANSQLQSIQVTPQVQIETKISSEIQNNISSPSKSGLNSFITQVSQNAPLISLGINKPQIKSTASSSATKVSSPKSSNNTPSNRQLNSKIQTSNTQYGNSTPLSASAIASTHKFKSFRHQNSGNSFAANKVAQSNNLTGVVNIAPQPHILPDNQSTSESNESQHPSSLSPQAKENNFKNNNNNTNNNSASKTLKKSTNSLKKQESMKVAVSSSIPEHLYYASSLAHAFENPGDLAVVPSLARDHLVQTMQSINFSRMITPPTMEQIKLKRVPLPPIKDKLTKTLIFDLDETLIHCNENADVPSDVTIDITFPTGEQVQAGINIRPYAVECLKELSELYEIIVFTASHSCYANVVLDYLDPQKKYISHRLFREQCVLTEEGVYVKDLRVIGNRSLENMLLVDNAAYSFGFQLDNGIPILPFYDHEHDVELKHLIAYLKNLYLVENAREHNKKTLKISQFSEYQDPSVLLKALYPELLKRHISGNNNNTAVGLVA